MARRGQQVKFQGNPITRAIAARDAAQRRKSAGPARRRGPTSVVRKRSTKSPFSISSILKSKAYSDRSKRAKGSTTYGRRVVVSRDVDGNKKKRVELTKRINAAAKKGGARTSDGRTGTVKPASVIRVMSGEGKPLRKRKIATHVSNQNEELGGRKTNVGRYQTKISPGAQSQTKPQTKKRPKKVPVTVDPTGRGYFWDKLLASSNKGKDAASKAAKRSAKIEKVAEEISNRPKQKAKPRRAVPKDPGSKRNPQGRTLRTSGPYTPKRTGSSSGSNPMTSWSVYPRRKPAKKRTPEQQSALRERLLFRDDENERTFRDHERAQEADGKEANERARLGSDDVVDAQDSDGSIKRVIRDQGEGEDLGIPKEPGQRYRKAQRVELPNGKFKWIRPGEPGYKYPPREEVNREPKKHFKRFHDNGELFGHRLVPGGNSTVGKTRRPTEPKTLKEWVEMYGEDVRKPKPRRTIRPGDIKAHAPQTKGAPLTPAMEELEDAVAQHRLNRRMGKSTRTGGAYNVSDALLKRKLKEKREAARGRGPTRKYPKTPKKGGARVRGYSTQQAKIAEEKNVAAHKAMTSSKQRQVPVEDHLRSVIAKKVTGTSGVYGPKTKDGKRPTRSYIKIMPNNESVDSSEFGKFHTRANQGFGATGGLREPDTGSYPFREVDDLLDGGGKSRAKTDRSDAPNPKTVARGKKKVRHQVVIDKDGKVKRRPDTGSVVYTQDASKERTVKGVQTPKHTAAVRLNDGSLDPKAYVDKPGPNRDDKQKRLAEQRAKDNYLKYKEIQESRGKKVKPYSGRETSQPRWIAELRQRRQLKEAMVRGLGAKGKRKPIKSAGRKVSNHVVVNPDGSLGPPRERSYNAAVAGRAEKANAGISSQLQTSKPGSPKAADKKALARALAGKSPKGVVSRRSGTKKPNTNAYINPRGVQGPPRESTARKKALARALSQARRDSNVSKKIEGEKAAEAAREQEHARGITPLDDDNFPKTSQQKYPSAELEGRETKRYKPGTKARLSDYKPSKNSDSPMVDDEVVKKQLARRRKGKQPPVRTYPSAKDNDTVKVGQRVGKRNPAKVTKVKDGIATVKTVDADGKVIRGKKGKTARIPTTKLKNAGKKGGKALGGAAIPLTAYTAINSKDKGEQAVASGDTAAMIASFTKHGRHLARFGGIPLTLAMLTADGMVTASKNKKAFKELKGTKEYQQYKATQKLRRDLNKRANADRFSKGKAPRAQMPKLGSFDPVAYKYGKKRKKVRAKYGL